MNLPGIEGREAAVKLREGALVAAILDGSLCILCDARNDEALKRMRQLKNRTAAKGFTILVDSDARMNRYVKVIPSLAWDIIDTAIDPIILILPQGQNTAKDALALDGSIAIRMLREPEAIKLVQIANGPLACTALPGIDGKPAKSIHDADPNILQQLDYILILPGSQKPLSGKSIPIIALGADNEVKIIRP